MSDSRYAGRRARLWHAVRKNCDAFLATSVVNVTWLTGFTGDSSYLLLQSDRETIISDSRYTTQLEEECPGLELEIRPHTRLLPDAVVKALKQRKLRRVGIEAGVMTVGEFQKYAAALPGVDLVPIDGAVEELRMVKDAGELAELRAAIKQAERGFQVMRAELKPEQTELQLAHRLEQAMRDFGAAGAAFPPIVAAGARSALPHARATPAPIGDAAFVLVDWGACSAGGYRSDLTRMLITRKPPARLPRLYEIVLAAQAAGIAAMQPGADCSAADAAARKVIADAGYGKQFGHSLGHGIGLHIHEGPRASAVSKQKFQPGMVVTCEPGIYLPGWGGVRIEDDVLITKDGPEVLTSLPRDYDWAVAAI
jgi:Xaa-Pro aminopeptidase